jgi:hypothetical protein
MPCTTGAALVDDNIDEEIHSAPPGERRIHSRQGAWFATRFFEDKRSQAHTLNIHLKEAFRHKSNFSRPQVVDTMVHAG